MAVVTDYLHLASPIDFTELIWKHIWYNCEHSVLYVRVLQGYTCVTINKI